MRNHDTDAKIFRAFDNVNRLQILEMLRGGEKCACVLLKDLQITQPTLSHHMKILCDSGIVKSRKEEKWTYYSISEKGRKAALLTLKELTNQK